MNNRLKVSTNCRRNSLNTNIPDRDFSFFLNSHFVHFKRFTFETLIKDISVSITKLPFI